MRDWTQVPSSETVYQIPTSHWDCHLRTFDWSRVKNAEAKQQALLGFMDAHLRGDAPHLFLCGKQGSGKTHLGVGLYRWAVAVAHAAAAAFMHVPSVSRQVKERFGDHAAPDPLEVMELASLVVLDDPFGREPTDWDINQTIPLLVDTVYQKKASLVITANQALPYFGAKLHPHEMSRLRENATLVDFFNDDDYRRGT